ncbi:MAG: ABC transporter ATP-binding protein, partial [Bacteroidales bacterium]|nr:ABC transporter ATP-binding protein [Bacteroidales bacterium]
EPTNHLDMRSKDILKSALLSFDGTLIVVSHDREFLDGLVDKVFEFRNRKVREHLGGIYDFLQRRKLSSLRDIEKKDKTGASHEARKPEPGVNRGARVKERIAKEKTPADEQVVSDQKVLYEERKTLEKKIRKIANRIKALEHEIEEIEAGIARMDAMLMNPENISGMQVYEEYEQLKRRHDEALANWEKQTIQLEKTESRRK